MPEFRWCDFGKLESGDDLLTYLREREWRHDNYFHYTSLSNIDKILASKTFRISNVSRFNDEHDKEQFSPQDRFFSLCFSTGVNENLSLWYMYAGMNGRGGRLRFTRTNIQKLLENATYTLCETDENNGARENPVLLIPGESMKSRFADVIYRYERGNRVELKYNTMTNYNLSKAEFEKAKVDLYGREKGIVWYYEKETRLIIEVIGDTAKRIDENKKYFVEMTIPDEVCRSMKISLAPEILENEIDEIMKEYEHIREFVKCTSGLACSEYSGSIKMDFCKKCEKVKIQNSMKGA